MKLSLIIFLSITFLVGCSAVPTSKEVKSIQTIKEVGISYGYSPENAVKVGAYENKGKPHFNSNLKKYFSKLRGPNGERISYKRLGSCCHVESDVFPYGKAPLDKYEIKYSGLNEPLMIYINMYDFEKPLAPRGLILVD